MDNERRTGDNNNDDDDTLESTVSLPRCLCLPPVSASVCVCGSKRRAQEGRKGEGTHNKPVKKKEGGGEAAAKVFQEKKGRQVAVDCHEE